MVVDSIAAPFRHGFADDMGMRNRILSGMAQNLIKLATVSNLAVRKERGEAGWSLGGRRGGSGWGLRGWVTVNMLILGCSH